MIRQNRVLLVDLNNFARYPTISIGLLTAILRRNSFQVDVFSPMSTGVTGVIREKPVSRWGLAIERLKFRSAMSGNTWVKSARQWLSKTSLHAPKLATQSEEVAKRIAERLDEEEYETVLVSSYLIYYDLCHQIAEVCQQRGIPMLLGGPYFAQPEVRNEWMQLPGIAGLVGGEVEPILPELVRATIGRESLDRFEGVWSTDLNRPNARPLKDLDAVPFPDYSDFPWEKYPNRIIPIATGRGCSWGACTFCSDVTGSAHRTFRSRSPLNVMDEVEFQAKRFDAKLFVFTDPKLNSNLDVWDTLLEQMQQRVPGARWIGAVHIDSTRSRNGLTAAEFERAREAGMVRLTTGLESGSQAMLDRMVKGATVSTSSQAIRDAANAGISVRVTMIVGYPGETADDVLRTAEFLRDHADHLERVMMNRFHIRTGTRFHRDYLTAPDQFPDITNVRTQHRISVVEHDFGHREPAYRRAIDEVLKATHAINQRPLRDSAREFDGVM